jgi:hypothetical protein
MPANYVLLEKITVGAAGASSVTFSGIPQTGYTDLVIKYSARTDNSANGDNLSVAFNGSSASFTSRYIAGTGSAVVSGTLTNYFGYSNAATSTSNTFSNTEIYIPNYAGSNNKSFSIDTVYENNATAANSILNAGLWSNTAAITSIQISASIAFVQYSTFYLYGVAKLGTTPVIVPYATGGDIIDTDGTYWYHTFLSSGTFTPQKAITCDYLVVAGGGGGGSSNLVSNSSQGGGGGAGGLRSTVTATGGGGSLESALSLASGTGYTVTVGAGGVGQVSASATSGSNSVFSTITSTGGGRGGGYISAEYSPAVGGSGGGGGWYTSPQRLGAAGTANQGYAGGDGDGGGYKSGAGGGAGAVGGSSSGSAPGVGPNGGAGIATSISGSSVSYAGGGGGIGYGSAGGSGGSGGGGAGGAIIGGVYSAGVAGTANRGGGGGGGTRSDTTGFGANGGSGIVIVRYAV